jgi:HPt (histidine-containing phosphotransfer) domain-containing protein
MPEMDGYELARTIRTIESGNGRGRTPIVACTANALAGEAENCLAAGMDDYLAKPVELGALANALERWLPLPAAVPGDSEIPIDRSMLAEISGGDAAMERDILIDFREVNSGDAATLKDALDRRDLALVVRASHRIKGASRTIGAARLADVCERVERAGRASNWDAVSADREVLERELGRLNAWLARL